MKIDIFNHILPPRFLEKFQEVAGHHGDMVRRVFRGLFIRETIGALESLKLDVHTSDLIYRRNAEKLLRLK